MTDFLADPSSMPLSLSQALIGCYTVTPCRDGAQDILAEVLEQLGFRTKRYPFEGVDNTP